MSPAARPIVALAALALVASTGTASPAPEAHAVPAGQTPPTHESGPPTLFVNARIVDGTGGPAYDGELLVSGGRIAAIGAPGQLSRERASSVVDLGGRVLAPGFVDIHNHSTERILREPEATSQVAQGVTAILVGADGSSPWPIADYLARVDEAAPAIRVGTMVGHGTVRSRELGDDYARPATDEEVARMATLVREGMEDGAFGLSSGLEYDPGYYSETPELVELARVAAARGGFYMSHIRDEEEGLLEAVEEAIRIGREAGLPVQLSHVKAGNASVWGRSVAVLERMEAARRAGVDVLADQYPYAAWQSTLTIVVPSRRFDDREAVAAGLAAAGGADRLQIVGHEADPSIDGLRLDAVAERWGVDPVTAYQRILDNGGSGVIGHTMSDEDVATFLTSPLVMTASDGGIGSAHPRGAGAFARVLGHFTRERGLLELPRAVERGTSQPADRLGLTDRGRIRVGAIADLVAFDAQTVAARSTFEAPLRTATGVIGTWVAGVRVWDGEGVTGARPGGALRRR